MITFLFSSSQSMNKQNTKSGTESHAQCFSSATYKLFLRSNKDCDVLKEDGQQAKLTLPALLEMKE